MITTRRGGSGRRALLVMAATVTAAAMATTTMTGAVLADNMQMGGMVPGATGPSGLQCLAPDAASTPGSPVFELKAADGRMDMPDGNSIYSWGYAPSSAVEAQFPGPNLCVSEGDRVEINLTNAPGDGLTEDVSIVFPGQQDVRADGAAAQPQFGPDGKLTSLTQAVADGSRVSYAFTAASPGTYLYESGTNPEKQKQMGLHGGLVVRPAAGAGLVYNDPSTGFAGEYLMLLNEIDPKMHEAVEAGRPFDATKYHPRYFTINGRAFPDTLAPNNASYLPNQPYGAMVSTTATDGAHNPAPALVRYANAGYDNHYIHPHGNHVRLIGHDGAPFRSDSGADLSYEKFTQVVGAGQTYEGLFTWTDKDRFSATNPIPVQEPSTRNILKDPMSMYSGSPYLGEKAAGAGAHNECGEYYFVAHSHALNEMMNWDQGMGGMTTFFRVDPAAGC